MYCKNCGAELPDNAKFCPKCGTQNILIDNMEEDTDFPYEDAEEAEAPIEPDIAEEEENPEAPIEPDIAGEAESAAAPEGPGKRRRKRWIPAVIVVAAAVVVLIVLAATGILTRKNVNLNDYVSVEFDGYDGYGTAYVTFDTYQLGLDYDDKIQLKDSAVLNGYYDCDFSDVIYDWFDVYLEPAYGLSNGDEVTLRWDAALFYEEQFDAIFKNKVNVSYETETLTVSDLEETQTFDAFEGVGVTFSGTSPDVSAQITFDASASELPEGAEDYLYYSLSQGDWLAIGDTVTVTLDEDSANSIMQYFGVYPAEMSKDFVVEDVPYYVFSMDQIPDDAFAMMDSQAQDEFQSYVAKDWNVGTLTSLDYLGSYFLSPKAANSTNYENIIYRIYKYQSRLNDEKDVTGYWYCGFYDGIMLPDGTYSMDYMNYSTPGDRFQVAYDNERYNATYYGFTDLDSLFNNIVTSKVDEYTYESTVEE